jgi:hypothetical protein
LFISHPHGNEFLKEPLTYEGLFYLKYKGSDDLLFPNSAAPTAIYFSSDKLFYCTKTKDDNSLYVNTNNTVILKGKKEECTLHNCFGDHGNNEV